VELSWLGSDLRPPPCLSVYCCTTQLLLQAAAPSDRLRGASCRSLLWVCVWVADGTRCVRRLCSRQEGRRTRARALTSRAPTTPAAGEALRFWLDRGSEEGGWQAHQAAPFSRSALMPMSLIASLFASFTSVRERGGGGALRGWRGWGCEVRAEDGERGEGGPQGGDPKEGVTRACEVVLMALGCRLSMSWQYCRAYIRNTCQIRVRDEISLVCSLQCSSGVGKATR